MKYSTAIRNGLSRYAIDIALVACAVGLLLFAALGNRGNVTENATAPPTAVAPPPALTGIGKMSALPADTPYSLDVVQPDGGAAIVVASRPSVVTIPRHTQTIFTGWAVDGPGQRAADAVYVLLDGKPEAVCSIRIARADVAAAYKVDAYAMSGFACTIPATSMVAGRHAIQLDIVTQGDRSFYHVKFPTALVVR